MISLSLLYLQSNTFFICLDQSGRGPPVLMPVTVDIFFWKEVQNGLFKTLP